MRPDQKGTFSETHAMAQTRGKHLRHTAEVQT
jgi:hypothetical protein